MQMNQASNDSDDDMLSKDESDSPSMDEGSSRGGGFGGGTVLKKGPWTSTEDAILVDYVKKHGEGNWNAVQKHSGLSRCGKSCRLRWANHLRPNLKKGAFTADEERLIIELHAKMGNKWARMAGHLPGRTDNEIKNYWNTRIKRRQRAGLPLYPPDLCLQSFNEGQKNQNDGIFSDADGRQHDFLLTSNYDIPDIIFNNLKPDPGTLSYAPTFHDLSINSMLSQGLGPIQSSSFMPSTISRSKRNREPDTMFPDFSGTVSNGVSPFDQFPSESSKKIYHRPFALGYGFPYDPDPTCKNPIPFGGIDTGSHVLLNGNFSASKPLTGAPKLELPSLQYSESDYSTCDTPCASQLLSSEAADIYIQSPQPTVQMQSDCLSPRNNGLLEALLHEAQTLGTVKNRSLDKSSSSSVVTPIDVMDNSGLYLCETEWEEHSDPISPLGRSASSVFSEHTPICGSSLDESPLNKALCGYQIKRGAAEHVSTPDEQKKENSTRLDLSRPDALLNADWFDQSECTKDLAALLGDDFCNDYKQMGGASTSSLSQGWGLDSCPWNNMPAVCQMPELP